MSLEWTKKMLSRLTFRRAAKAELGTPYTMRFSAQQIMNALIAAYPSNAMLNKGMPSQDFENPVHEALESVIGWIQIICENDDLTDDEQMFVDALKALQAKFDQPGLEAEDLIEIPLEELQSMKDGLAGLTKIMNRLNYQTIPDSEDKFLRQMPTPPNTMPQLPPIPNKFWYLENPLDPDKFLERFKSHEPLTKQTDIDGRFTSDVRTKSAKEVFDILGYLNNDINQFLLNHGINFTANHNKDLKQTHG